MKRILITGIGQLNYLFQLYGTINHDLRNNIQFEALNLQTHNSNTENTAKSIFNKIHKVSLADSRDLLQLLPVLLFKGCFWKDLLLSLYDDGKLFNNIRSCIGLHCTALKTARYIDNEINCDIIQIHFPVISNSLFTHYLKNEKDYILTFWGSDAYRHNTLRNLNFLKVLTYKAIHITVTTNEMRFTLLAKFSFDLLKKISVMKFIAQEDFYEMHHKLKNNLDAAAVKSKYNIPEEKQVIAFGHNATSKNNHIPFIEEIKKSTLLDTNRLHFIFFLTYGELEKGYIDKLKELTTAWSCTYFTSFLSVEELVEIKSVTDIYIHMPETDGLSAFLTEYFYLNKKTIVGEWLPYNTFDDLRIDYQKIKDFNELDQKIIQALNTSTTQNNETIIKEHFFKDKIALQWIDFYKEIAEK